FEGTPPTILASEHLAHGDADLAGDVDYIVIGKSGAHLVPAGFVPDGTSERYARFRRADSTTASPPDCS
ncbi:MAG TPA: hypothetical protein VHN78_14560, partial [Chloroflexota bacterium]|nr:hypothetical protein [Chloroflexota bacterium]